MNRWHFEETSNPGLRGNEDVKNDYDDDMMITIMNNAILVCLLSYEYYILFYFSLRSFSSNK